ncbi:non-specific serine/threonine protein kinase [Rhizobium aethiopicum]|uniref:non-specific serine/threonine protein kinase n=1 Tax=Rhizobium aethiopicum TaxID=1138170 RepID=A0A7W6MG76_9HYPH|nr:serine/threonine protein kinase [Rhizobium aethiopicum]MBB4192160.1 non-specific serine/threonine protein kinase [Rhizobium aethiopicum]MBB4580895.1 non-specific serine/threonine protein kinase [Rhizobium aethiopicum]
MRSDLIARYTIGEPVYENEFIVYPAQDKRMDRSVFIVAPDVALKLDKARFERVWTSVNEAKSLTARRFVEIEDLIPPSPEDDNFYIVEKRPSKTLHQYLEETEMVAYDRAIEIGRHILEGLATLHGAGYAHNALTDQCIYVSEDYSGLSVRIGNLHLISKIGEHIIPPYAPEFGAPEIYASGTFSASAALDIYAMGMIAYKLFLPRQTYASVFDSVMVWEDEHQREQSWKNIHLDPSNIFPRLDVLIPGFPEGLASLVERMLSRDPAQRPRMGADALGEFSRVTTGIQPMAWDPRGGMPQQPEALKRKKWTLAHFSMIGALLLICIGVGVVTIPKLLRPDPKLVADVGTWKKEAESRRDKAIAAKAPERPSGDEARLSYDAGAAALTEANALLKDEDYKKALPGYQKAAISLGKSLITIAKENAEKAKSAAAAAGGDKAPSFAEADSKMKAAADNAAAQQMHGAVDNYEAARTAYDDLAKALTALTAAEKDAAAKRETVTRIGAGDSPDAAKASGLMTEAKAKAEQWQLPAATSGYGDAAKLFAALISDVMAAKDEATALRQNVTDLHASLTTRAGPADPTLAALAPKLTEADGRYTAEAYKLAIASYQPILTDLEALSARGFCPVAPNVAFETIPAGSYSLDNVRLMTSSLKELGGMLGVANGAVKVEKSFCMQAKAVTRAEMAEYYTANSDPASAQAYAGNPEQPADDVPLAEAQNYTAWLSKQLNAPVHLPSATEWMASAVKLTTEKLPDNGDIILQWSATPCEAGGNVAFMAQEGSTFVVCSDASAGGIFRVSAELR